MFSGKWVFRIFFGYFGVRDAHISVDDNAYSSRLSKCLVFEQYEDEEAWDETKQCYLTSWRSEIINDRSLCRILDVSAQSTRDPCIALSLKCQSPRSKARWKSDAIHVESDVLGRISLIVPTVIAYGSKTFQEKGVLLDNQIEEIMSNRRSCNKSYALSKFTLLFFYFSFQ